MIIAQRWFVDEAIDEIEPALRPERHADRDRAVELHDRRRRDLGELDVQRGDAHPIGVFGAARACVAGGDRGLQLIRAAGAAELFRAFKRGKATLDEQPVPMRTVLIEQQDRRAVSVGARVQARGLDFHQGDEPMYFAVVRGEFGENAAEAQRLLAQRRAHPVVAGRRRVAFVEDEIDHVEHRSQTRRAIFAARQLEGHVRLAQCALGAHDALGDGRFGHEKRTRDLVGGEAAEQAQGERHARFRREHRMTGGEHQPQ